MKSLIWFVAAVCMVTNFSPAHAQAPNAYANTEVKTANGDLMLLGHCEMALLKQGAFQQWFVPGFTSYQPDSFITRLLHPLLKNKTIEIFLGTWCGDSRREVPRMLKMLESSGFDIQKVKLLFVSNAADMYKQSPQHEESGKNIKRVPTLIVYNQQIEIGRIIEYPVASLEKDLLSILKGEKYVPNYSQLR
ncbi:MAG: thiol reductase thioredoxin [Bacteroidota bacterium]|jgi:thiol-disulfide isomerase/thioredoxin